MDSSILDGEIGLETSFEFRLDESLTLSFCDADSNDRPNIRLRLVFELSERGVSF
jgi:hypothetical protein